LKLLVRSLAIALLSSASAALAQPEPAMPVLPPVPAAGTACPPVETGTNDLAILTSVMLEPRKIASFADLFKSFPPEAITKMVAAQKTAMERQAKDWPNLCRYAAENAQVLASGTRPRVVFLGDSITENWKPGDPSLFSATTLDRGIGGQTTPQILLRFYQDVVALRPRVVHIMAGVNDIMGNTGPSSDTAIVNNIRAMIDIAKANGIRVVLSGITPAKAFVARPNFDMVPRIAAVNRQLAELARDRRISFADYAPVLANDEGGLKDALGNDGLHPNRDGYALMRPIAEQAITRAAK
jgi:lysophospholipase L1-like esterase